MCILDERGQIVLQEWVVTTPEAFFKRFHGETKMDIAMEVGAHSRWTSDLLRRCGHHLVVADPSQLGLITKSRQERQTGCGDIGAVAAGRSAFVVTPRASSGKPADGFDGDPHAGQPDRNPNAMGHQRTRSGEGDRRAAGQRGNLELSPTGRGIPEPLRPAVAPVLEVIDRLNEAAYEYD